MPVDQLDLGYDDMRKLVAAVRALPRRRELECSACGAKTDYLSLETYAACDACGLEHKVRSFGAYTEPQDVISCVLEWLGDGPDFDAIMANRDRFRIDDFFEEATAE